MKEFVEKLMERLEEYTEYDIFDIYKEEPLINISFETLDDIVNQLAEEYKLNLSENLTGWIPTTERLPEKNAIVLVCDKDGWISVKVNMPYAGTKNDFECGYYTAWMPLPPAYVPEEGRE